MEWCLSVKNNLSGGRFKLVEQDVKRLFVRVRLPNKKSDSSVFGEVTQGLKDTRISARSVWTNNQESRNHAPNSPSKGEDAEA